MFTAWRQRNETQEGHSISFLLFRESTPPPLLQKWGDVSIDFVVVPLSRNQKKYVLLGWFFRRFGHMILLRKNTTASLSNHLMFSTPEVLIVIPPPIVFLRPQPRLPAWILPGGPPWGPPKDLQRTPAGNSQWLLQETPWRLSERLIGDLFVGA